MTSTKWFAIGSFSLTTLLAYIGGFAGSSFVERKLATESVAPEIVATDFTDIEKPIHKTTQSKRRAVSNERQYVQTIVNRSIFDSSQAGQKSSMSSEPAEGDSVESSLQLTLLATIIASPEQYSVALIQDESGSASTYGVGYDLIGQATVTKIEKSRVYFQRNNSDQLEYIEIGGESAKSDAPTKSTDTSTEDGDVQKVGNNKYVVDQSVLDEILANPEKLYTQVRVTPHKDQDGNIDGYRMTGIRRKSLFYKLGIKNGDIVHSVNGQPLNSLSAAMDAYNSLGNSKDFNFDVTRRKNKQTFEYEVR
jgi:type II secretion system protein C